MLFQFLIISIFYCSNSFHTISKANKLISLSLNSSPKIALTRESGTNQKLNKLLVDYDCYEIPCIQFFEGQDAHILKDEMIKHDVIVITSPQVHLLTLVTLYLFATQLISSIPRLTSFTLLGS